MQDGRPRILRRYIETRSHASHAGSMFTILTEASHVNFSGLARRMRSQITEEWEESLY